MLGPTNNAIARGLVRGALLCSLLGAPPSTPAVAGCRLDSPPLTRQPTADEWRQVDRGEVVSWMIEAEGSPVKEGIALGLVEAPPARVYAVVTDNARFADFMPYVEESTVETRPDGTLVNRQRLDLPWPVRDREYEIALVNEVLADAEPPLWRSSWSHLEGFGNIEESRGAWRVFACGDISLVEYQVLTDPGGSIPNFLKNSATRRSLRSLVEAVRERVGDPSYDPSG